MTDCRLLHENLYGYAAKELPDTLMDQLDQHIAVCLDCKQLLEQFNDVLNAIGEHVGAEPLPYAGSRLLHRLEAALEMPEKSSFVFSKSILQPALISLGMLLALAIGFLIGTEGAGRYAAYNENTIQEVRSDLNVPDFMTDELLEFTE
ncbi:MAG TPA: hypothetical protein PLJ84_00390 [Bacteroidales bacterium]|nr:hypothetical protein [Bacteroidales bacterium]HPT01027.1 hypothetical protein [Bacteroidales bacterium]